MPADTINIDLLLPVDDADRLGIENCLTELAQCQEGSRKFRNLKETYDGFILNFYKKGADKRVIPYYSEEFRKRVRATC